LKTRPDGASPNPRHRSLLGRYRLLHEQGGPHLGIPPEATFPDNSLPRLLGYIDCF